MYWGNSNWDIRAGKQIVTWGVADGLRVTDLISPMDYTEFLAQDYDDIRVPVGALRARYIHDVWSVEAVLVPVPEFFKIPTDPSNPWSRERIRGMSWQDLTGIQVLTGTFLSNTTRPLG